MALSVFRRVQSSLYSSDVMSIGRTIRLFLVDGTPSGLLTAEIPNWTGHILVAPRSRLAEALSRPEAGKTGVYLLIGDEAGRSLVYVGEGDCISDRIKKHAKDPEKDFWERVCLITSKDVNLTKSHVRYLESRLVQIIQEGSRAALHNGNDPPAGSLPESDTSEMEFFLGQLQILLPTVGLDFLRPVLAPKTDVVNARSDATDSAFPTGDTPVTPISLVLRHQSSGVNARAIEQEDEIVVLRGSLGTSQVNAVNDYAPLRQKLLQEGKLVLQENGQTLFIDDVAFKSPSAAAAVLNNRNSAGPREWKLEGSGETLRDWRNRSLD